MRNLLKNRKYVAVAAVMLVVLLGAFYFLFFKSPNSADDSSSALPTQSVVPAIAADKIGLTLVLSADMHKATMTVTKTDDISSLDYQLSYNAEVSGQTVPRGTIGHIDVKTEGKAVSQDMVLGTCSDVCHYDVGIKEVKLIVKVTKTDGKVYQAEVSPSSSK